MVVSVSELPDPEVLLIGSFCKIKAVTLVYSFVCMTVCNGSNFRFLT